MGEVLEDQVARAKQRLEWAKEVARTTMDMTPGMDLSHLSDRELIEWAETEAAEHGGGESYNYQSLAANDWEKTK